jgi:DnaJ family protein A protein 3
MLPVRACLHLVARTALHRQLSTSAALLGKDYYKTLGVPQNASGKDIKKAYYQLAKKYHPDTNKGEPTAEKLFQDVSEAYEVLSDDRKKADYDSFGAGGGGSTKARRGDGDGFGGFGPQGFENFRQKANESGGGRDPRQRSGRAEWNYQSNVNPEELFRTIFGEFSRRAGARPGQAQSPFDEIFNNFNFRGGQETETTISFMQAAKGVTKEVEVVRMSRMSGMERVMVQVPVPAGIMDGQTMRLSLGQGQEVFVTVRVTDSDYFRREGHDVHTQASISLSQALLGGVIRVAGLQEDVNLRIPAGTSSHTAMTLSGRGIKHMESHSQHGDHIVHITIKLPVRLTAEQEELIREFARTEDTPGTVNGETQRDPSSGPEAGTETTNDDVKGTIAKISDAINQNETVAKVKKMFGL